ncbi:glycosyltransferase family 2 protein [Lutibacter sp.]
MKFSLIICTYQRPNAVVSLLKSVQQQMLYPNEIIIVDGSTDAKTTEILLNHSFEKVRYYKVDKKNRGLTKQRNFGISKIANDTDIVCFLDDDTLLDKNYFKELMQTYEKADAIAAGGIITNEVPWKSLQSSVKYDEFEMDGFVRKMGQRNVIRKRFHLLSDKPPGIMPKFSNGFSISFLPPTGKCYEVEYFMGGVSSFKKELLDKIKFSTYFEGYGLYEDLDFCLRASKLGKLYVNTNAKVEHYHEVAGRPNKFEYGKMVVRNGWYVWRVKYPNPSLKARFKWNMVIILLMKLRFLNVFTTNRRKEAFTEGIGRFVGWISLFLNKPKRDL